MPLQERRHPVPILGDQFVVCGSTKSVSMARNTNTMGAAMSAHAVTEPGAAWSVTSAVLVASGERLAARRGAAVGHGGAFAGCGWLWIRAGDLMSNAEGCGKLMERRAGRETTKDTKDNLNRPPTAAPCKKSPTPCADSHRGQGNLLSGPDGSLRRVSRGTTRTVPGGIQNRGVGTV